jgi:hypothetical protein
MNRASPQMRNFASRLITLEANAKTASETTAATAFPIPEKLRPTLSMLMGNAGFRALLARALTLATEEAPWLRRVKITADGTLEGWEELHAQLGPDKFLEGRVVLSAHLLGLLVAFIGENLTVRLVSEVWPKLSVSDLDKGEKNEKTRKTG